MPLTLLEVKQTFLILTTTASFEEMIFEHFLLATDHNRCVSRLRFETILKNLSKILTYLGEGENFSNSTIQQLLHESFNECPGIVGLNEYQFNCLWKNSNENLMFFSNVLSLTRRLRESQFVLHDNRCVGCNVASIQGLRFKCQRCKQFSLCFTCFTNGFSNQKHDISHRMYEINSAKVKSSKFLIFFTKICGIFTRTTTADLETMSDVPSDGTMNLETKLIDSIDVKGDIEEAIETHSTYKGKNESIDRNVLDNSGLLTIIDLLIDETE